MNPWVEWLWKASWQASLLVPLVLGIQWMLRRQMPPEWRCVLWWVVLLRLCMPIFPSSSVSLYNMLPPTQESDRLGISAAIVREPANSIPTSFIPKDTSISLPEKPTTDSFPNDSSAEVLTVQKEQPVKKTVIVNSSSKANHADPRETKEIPWMVLLWSAGAGLMAMSVLRGVVHLNRICRDGKRLEDTSITALLKDCSGQLQIHKQPMIIVSRQQSTPALIGWFRPVIVVPEHVLKDFNLGELKHILLHELAHLKRRDVLINWLHAALLILHWFNPILWFAFYRMRQDRELAVDAMALKASGQTDGRSYGNTLLKLLETLNRPNWMPVSVGIAEGKHAMRTRLRAIMSFGTLRTWKGYLFLGMCALSLIVLTDAVPVALDQSEKTNDGGSIADSEFTNTYTEEEANRKAEFLFIDQDSSDPLSNVIVRFNKGFYDGTTKEWSVKTDDEGRCLVEWNDADVKEFRYTTHQDGYLTLTGTWKQDIQNLLPEKVEHQLSQGSEIGGVVVNERGEPVEGARIYFDRPGGRILDHGMNGVSGFYTTYQKTSAGQLLDTTDQEGYWSARCIWSGSSSAHLRVRHSDYADKQYSTRITPAMESEGKGNSVPFEDLANGNAQFELAKGQSFLGRVKLPNGDPARDVIVRYMDRALEENGANEKYANYNDMGVWETRTDSQGIFSTVMLSPKRIYFAIQGDGYAPISTSVDVLSEPANLDFQFNEGVSFTTTVTDQSGNPIEGASVTLQDWSTWGNVQWETVTDDNGAWRWEHAPVDRFLVRIEKAGYLPLKKIIQPKNPKPLVMSKPLRLTVKVRDADSGLPVDSFKVVWASDPDDIPWRQHYSLPGRDGEHLFDLERLYAPNYVPNYFFTFMFQVKAPGYAPWTSSLFEFHKGASGEMEQLVELKKQDVISGIVFDADNNAVVNAQVAVITQPTRLRLMGQPHLENLESSIHSITDSDGRFVLETSVASFANQLDISPRHIRSLESMQHPLGIVVVHPDGVSFLDGDSVTSELKIKLEPWGQIEGMVLEYDKPLVNEELQIWTSHLDGAILPEIGFFRPVTDESGRFSANYIPYGNLRAYRMIKLPRGGSSGPSHKFSLVPGQTLEMTIGGQGRPIVGKMELMNPYLPIDWRTNQGHKYVMTSTPQPSANFKTREEFTAWRQQPEIKEAYKKIRNHPIFFDSDGSFRIEEVIPGKYDFSIELYNPLNDQALAYGDFIASFHSSFEVPKSENANSKIPFDVGTFEMRLKPKIGEGSTVAPDISATDLEGNPFELSALKGKYVLLDFWATWCGPCIAEIPYLIGVWEKYKDREDFALVGLSVDKTVEDPIRFSKKNNLPGLQVYIGDIRGNEIATTYNVQGIPATYLINPEGKIIAEGLSGHDIEATLKKFLPQD